MNVCEHSTYHKKIWSKSTTTGISRKKLKIVNYRLCLILEHKNQNLKPIAHKKESKSPYPAGLYVVQTVLILWHYLLTIHLITDKLGECEITHFRARSKMEFELKLLIGSQCKHLFQKYCMVLGQQKCFFYYYYNWLFMYALQLSIFI